MFWIGSNAHACVVVMGVAATCSSGNTCAKPCKNSKESVTIVMPDATCSYAGAVNAPVLLGPAIAQNVTRAFHKKGAFENLCSSGDTCAKQCTSAKDSATIAIPSAVRSNTVPIDAPVLAEPAIVQKVARAFQKTGTYDNLPRSYKGPQEVDIAVASVDKALLDGCQRGDFTAVVDAISDGADIHCRSTRGLTALMLSASSFESSAIAIMEFLLEVAAHVEARDAKGWSPLHYACRTSQVSTTKLLLERKAGVNARTADGQTPIMLAAAEGSERLIDMLHLERAQIDKRDLLGWTALFHAVEAGRLSIASMLLKISASAEIRANDGTTCLMIAARRGHINLTKLIYKRSLIINNVDVDGNTALMHAILSGRDKCARWLLHLDDIVWRRPNEDGLIPMEAARQQEMPLLVKWMESEESRLRAMEDTPNPDRPKEVK